MTQLLSPLARMVLAISLVVVGFNGPVEADSYKLDPSHAAVVFKIKHLEYSYTYGFFKEISGRFTTGDKPSFEFTAKTQSLDTGFAKRDEHLRSPDFLNAKQFPVITFKSTGVESDGDLLHLTGDLSLHGVTQSITVDLKKMGEGDDPWGNYRTGYSTQFTIKRSDFGMDKMLDMVGDEVTLMVSFEGTRE